MMQFNKKGLSPIGILGEIVIVIAVILILLGIVIIPRIFSQSDIVGVQIGGIQGDADKDGIRNLFDKCPCTFGDSISEGCPATFTDVQKEEDVKKYNSEPVCGIATIENTADENTQSLLRSLQTLEKQCFAGDEDSCQTAARLYEEDDRVKDLAKAKALRGKKEALTVQKSEPAAFKNYRSIEIFGNTDDESDPALKGNIRLACTGWAGKDCHSEDNDCDNDEFSYDPTIKDGCWIMASEEDPGQNDCGQLKVDNGAIISLKEFSDLSADPNQYLSIGEEMDPKNLFRWDWKSTPEYGSLICNKGFWYGCKEGNEGRELSELINGQKYKCISSEWIK